MKKYVKPELFYERYELSQHIADCAWELQAGDENSCAATPDQNHLPGYNWSILNNDKVCEAGPDTVEDYCYQPGTSGEAGLFAS